MAEFSDISKSKPLEDQDETEEKAKVDMDADSGDDFSSGSDRSLDADDAESAQFNGDVDANIRNSSSFLNGLAEQRKKRHGSHGSRRHKGGSRHKNRGFHPYMDPQDQMNLKRQSQELKEKENATAVVRQEGEGHFMNFPIAPFNSTQYLMDEHDSGSPAVGMHRTCSSSSKLSDVSQLLHSVSSTPAESSCDQQILDRKDKEFTDIYATVHAESLKSLPKDELVKNYMNLEEKVASLQKKVAEAEQLMRQNDDSGESHGGLGDAQIEALKKCSPYLEIKSSIDSTGSFDSNSGDQPMSEELNKPTISVGDSEVPSMKEDNYRDDRNTDVASR